MLQIVELEPRVSGAKSSWKVILKCKIGFHTPELKERSITFLKNSRQESKMWIRAIKLSNESLLDRFSFELVNKREDLSQAAN